MSPGRWFRTIIKRRKVKQNRTNEEKAHLATKTSNGTSGRRHHINGESSTSSGGDLSMNSRLPRRSLEDVAAKRIQAAFRKFMARKRFCGLKETDRFHNLKQGDKSRKQASTALSFIHSWIRMQHEIRARRLCMVTEYRIRQKKLENQLKLDVKLHELEVEWCSGSETMEEILSRIHQREEAAVKRERAMAYAFSHQWRANSILHLNPASYSLDKGNWGWSWKERWIAARPWEVRAHAHPTIPKKMQTKQGSKLNKLTYQPEFKISVSPRPALSNGKATAKVKK